MTGEHERMVWGQSRGTWDSVANLTANLLSVYLSLQSIRKSSPPARIQWETLEERLVRQQAVPNSWKWQGLPQGRCLIWHQTSVSQPGENGGQASLIRVCAHVCCVCVHGCVCVHVCCVWKSENRDGGLTLVELIAEYLKGKKRQNLGKG
jgi:hypothetical protein